MSNFNSFPEWLRPENSPNFSKAQLILEEKRIRKEITYSLLFIRNTKELIVLNNTQSYLDNKIFQQAVRNVLKELVDIGWDIELDKNLKFKSINNYISFYIIRKEPLF